MQYAEYWMMGEGEILGKMSLTSVLGNQPRHQTGKNIHWLSERLASLGIIRDQLRDPHKPPNMIVLDSWGGGSIGHPWYRETPISCTATRLIAIVVFPEGLKKGPDETLVKGRIPSTNGNERHIRQSNEHKRCVQHLLSERLRLSA